VFTFATTSAIIKSNVPAVPRADDLSILNNTFAQREAEMWAEILDRVNPSLPSKDCKFQAVCRYGMTESFRGEFGN